jgi:hypothetical protein
VGNPHLSVFNDSEYINDTFVSSATLANTFVAGHTSGLYPDILTGDQSLNSHNVGCVNLDQTQTNTTWAPYGGFHAVNATTAVDGPNGYILPATDAQGLLTTIDEFANINGPGHNFLHGHAPPATAAQGPLTMDEIANFNGHGNNSLPAVDPSGLNFIDPQFITNNASAPFSRGAPATTPSMNSATPIPPASPTMAPSARYACSICGKTFGRPSDLRRHAGKHRSGPRPFSCPSERCAFKAERGFYRKDKMVNHVKTRHPELNVRGL